MREVESDMLRRELEILCNIRKRYLTGILLQKTDVMTVVIRDIERLSARLRELESPIDEWEDAKKAIPVHIKDGGHRVKAVARYAEHLEKELKNREFWRLRFASFLDDTKKMYYSQGGVELFFSSKRDAEAFSKNIVHQCVPEIYEGKQQ